MTQEERIAKLEASNAMLVKEKSAVGTTVKQRERDIADLTRQNAMIKANVCGVLLMSSWRRVKS
jgi:hypothetical protein